MTFIITPTEAEDLLPAFPTSPSNPDGSRSSYSSVYGGMSLRDWLAGQALQGAAFALNENSEVYESTLRRVARKAYALADAMLAERAKP